MACIQPATGMPPRGKQEKGERLVDLVVTRHDTNARNAVAAIRDKNCMSDTFHCSNQVIILMGQYRSYVLLFCDDIKNYCCKKIKKINY